VQFSGFESLAVKRRLYVCYSTAIIGVWTVIIPVIKFVARKRRVETAID
jgi:hypothetical protein